MRGMRAEDRRGRWLCLVPLALIIVLAALAAPAFAQDDSQPADDIVTRPPTSGTEVEINLFVRDILTVDELNTLVEIDALLSARWMDKRQSFDCDAERSGPRVYSGESATEQFKAGLWQPEFHVREGRGPRAVSELAVIVSCEGSVRYEERFVATLDQDFDGLNEFPFDHHTIRVTIEPFAIGQTGRVIFRRFEKLEGLTPDFDLFDAGNWESEEWTFSATNAGQTIEPSSVALTTLVEIDRKSTFYILNIVLPLIVIVALSWAVFWMKPSALAERMGVATTSLLTVVAFDFLTNDDLPKLAYTTRLDAFYNVSYLFVALTVAASLIVLARSRETLPGWLAGEGNQRFAQVDSVSQRVFPVAYLGMVSLAMVGVFSPGAGGYRSWFPKDDPMEDFFEVSTGDFEEFETAFGRPIDDIDTENLDLSAGIALTATISEPAEVDAYDFCADGGDSISISMRHLNPGKDLLDPLLALYTDDGVFVMFDDDGWVDFDSIITLEAALEQCYVLLATDVSGEGTGDYLLTDDNERSDDDFAFDEGITLEELYADVAGAFGVSVSELDAESLDLTEGFDVSRAIDTPGEIDAYELCTAPGAAPVVSMEHRNSETEYLDPLLLIYNETGSLLALDDDGGGDLNSLLVFEPPAPSCYYLIATDLSGAETGAYRLTGG